jgi:hypothetical protein
MTTHLGTFMAPVIDDGTPNTTRLVGFVDPDWASDVNDRNNISGFVFMLGGAGPRSRPSGLFRASKWNTSQPSMRQEKLCD